MLILYKPVVYKHAVYKAVVYKPDVYKHIVYKPVKSFSSPSASSSIGASRHMENNLASIFTNSASNLPLISFLLIVFFI